MLSVVLASGYLGLFTLMWLGLLVGVPRWGRGFELPVTAPPSGAKVKRVRLFRCSRSIGKTSQSSSSVTRFRRRKPAIASMSATYTIRCPSGEMAAWNSGEYSSASTFIGVPPSEGILQTSGCPPGSCRPSAT